MLFNFLTLSIMFLAHTLNYIQNLEVNRVVFVNVTSASSSKIMEDADVSLCSQIKELSYPYDSGLCRNIWEFQISDIHTIRLRATGCSQIQLVPTPLYPMPA